LPFLCRHKKQPGSDPPLRLRSAKIVANLRLIFSAVSTPAGPNVAHFVTCATGLQNARAPLEQKVLSDESRQVQLSSLEEKGKALEVAPTAGSADAFPVQRERHHNGMEIRNGETKRDTLRKLKREERGAHTEFGTGNTTQTQKSEVRRQLWSQQSCQLSSQLCS